MNPPRIAVVGAGAIGGVLAWSLAKAGLSPLLVARGSSASVIARDGLTVDRNGVRETVDIRVVGSGAEAGPQDVVIGTMKAQDWPGAVTMLQAMIGRDTALIPAINGIPWWYFAGSDVAGTTLACLDPANVLGAHIPHEALIGCVVYMGATRTSPGKIDWASGRRLVLGNAVARSDGRLAEVAAVLRRADLDIAETDNVRREVWTKLLGNAVFNPLSVIATATMDEMIDDPRLRQICVSAMEELIAVARSVGVTLPVNPEQRLAMNNHMRGFRTSTLQDFEAGRPLEIAALVDAPCAIGAANGVETPVLRVLSRLATRFEMTRRCASNA